MAATTHPFRREQLTALLHELNVDLVRSELELLVASGEAELVAAMRKTAAKLAAASTGWAAMAACEALAAGSAAARVPERDLDGAVRVPATPRR